MPSGVKVVAVHIKVRYREQVIRELCALGLSNLEIGESRGSTICEVSSGKKRTRAGI
jgi:hypothetical protein